MLVKRPGSGQTTGPFSRSHGLRHVPAPSSVRPPPFLHPFSIFFHPSRSQNMQANGGGERDRTREGDSREGGEGVEPGEDEALACKINDLQSSTDKRKAGFIPMHHKTVAPDAEGWGPMEGAEGVGELFRCNRHSRSHPLTTTSPRKPRMLTARPTQVDGHHCTDAAARRAPRGQVWRLHEHGAHDGGAAGTEPGGHHWAD